MLAATATTPQLTETPEKNLGFFRYARNFTKGLIKDAKFWSRFNAIPNGVIFVAQGVGGAFLLASAPLAAQVAGIAGCVAMAGIGLYGIGYGFPRAWQSMEALCTRTFPTFNPLKKVRAPVAAFAHKIGQKPWVQKIRNSRLAKLKPHLKTERQQDIFLAGLTMEGASAAAIACAVMIAPHVMALPAITIAGGVLMAGAFWTIGTCVFDVYCSGKTLFQAWRDKRNEKKAQSSAPKPAPEPQAPGAKPVAASASVGFNKKADIAPPPTHLPARPCNQPPAGRDFCP